MLLVFHKSIIYTVIKLKFFILLGIFVFNTVSYKYNLNLENLSKYNELLSFCYTTHSTRRYLILYIDICSNLNYSNN